MNVAHFLQVRSFDPAALVAFHPKLFDDHADTDPIEDLQPNQGLTFMLESMHSDTKSIECLQPNQELTFMLHNMKSSASKPYYHADQSLKLLATQLRPCCWMNIHQFISWMEPMVGS